MEKSLSDREIGRLQGQIREREENYRDLIEGSVQGIIIRTLERRLFANESSVRMFGFDSEQEFLALEDSYAVFAPHEREVVRSRHEARLKGAPVSGGQQIECRRKDGSTLWVWGTSRAVNWKGERAVQSTFTDITEQKKAEEELRRSESHYRGLLYGLPVGLAIHREFKPLFSNDAFAHIFGYASGDEICRLRSHILLVARQDRARMHAYRRARLAGKEAPPTYTFTGVRKDGSTITCSAMVKVVQWEGHSAIQLCVVDITEQERAAEQIRASEERFRGLIEGSVQGISIRGAKRRLLVNEAFAKMAGYASAADVMAEKVPHPVSAPNDVKRIRAIHKAILAGDMEQAQFEFEANRLDGSRRYITASARRIEWGGEPAVQTTCTDITERRLAEESLRASERRYRDLIEGSLQGINIRNRSKRLLVNESLARMFGYSKPEEIIDAKPFARIAPHDRERVRRIFESLYRRKQPPRAYEYEATRKDGSTVWLAAVSRRIEWDGRPTVQTTYTDISENKLAEQELRSSEQRYRELIEGSVQGINIRTRDKRLLVNESLARMFGYAAPEEMMAMEEVCFHVAPHDRERALRIFDSLFRRRQPPRAWECEAFRKDGSPVWVAAISRRIDWDGRPAVQTTFTDISESKLAVEELRSSEERYRELIEGSVQGILIRTEKPVLVNEALVKMFGYSSVREIMRMKGFGLVAPAERERNAYYRAARMRGEVVPTHYEMEGVKKDGTPIWLSVVARLIRWKGELAIQTTFTDITERRRTEAELIEAKMQSIGMMASGIAGAFNTIYTSLLGTISMARMEAYALGADRIVETLSEAERTTDSAKKVIQDLMVLNRAGVPVKERIAVQEVLKDVLPLSGESGMSGKVVPIRPSKVRINLNLASGLWAVHADKVQMHEALAVLISNGLDSTPGGGVLGISAENVQYRNPNRALNLEPGKYVRITIRDQGMRISPEHLKKIFDPYFSPTRENGSIGMASAYSIVRQHEGTIKVVSNAATGNRFQVFLPAHVEEEPRRRRRAGRPRPRRTQPFS